MDAIVGAARALARHFLKAVVCVLPVLAVLPAQAQLDPPARVATLTEKQGSVAWAPAGETEWLDASRNRPLTRGDRLWVDEGGRAELHLGSAALQLDSRSFLDLTDVDAGIVQATLNQGSAVARVRQLASGDNFELDTPQLAFRALAPGEYRVDVDLDRQLTRVTVRSGAAAVYGANGASRQLGAGEQLAFSGRDLALALGIPSLVEDDFDRWAAARNRDEDRSMAARYVPRTVVGYAELDRYGRWAVDTTWGPVWYPAVTVVDWAPYRYGHWEWIAPWGWTWIDDAPWGFAPFHYGRWVQVGPRWAWVPGRLGPRPVYAPALVSFVGGNGWSLSISAGPGIGWYPLAPWEPWRPWYRASPVYVQQVNQIVVVRREPPHFQRPPGWFSAMPLHEFEAGRPVPAHPAGVDRRAIAQAPLAPPPVVPDGRRFAVETQRPAPLRAAPPAVQALPAPVAVRPPRPAPPRRFEPAAPVRGQPPAAVAQPPAGPPPGLTGRDAQERPRLLQEQQRAQQEQQRAQQQQERAAQDPARAQREQQQAQRAAQEQQRTQQDQQRAVQEQQRAQQQQDRAAQDQARAQREQQQRTQQEQQRAAQEQQRAQQQDRAAQDQARIQREQQRAAQEQQRAQQEQQRAQQEQQRAVQQQQRAQQEQLRIQREQQRAAQEQQRAQQQQQERALQEQQRQQREAAPRPPQPVPPVVAPPQQPQQAPQQLLQEQQRVQREQARAAQQQERAAQKAQAQQRREEDERNRRP